MLIEQPVEFPSESAVLRGFLLRPAEASAPLPANVRGGPEHTTGPLPVVSADQQPAPSVRAQSQAFRWFIDPGVRPGSGWLNRVTRVQPPTPVPCSPYRCTPFVQAATLLMVAPDDDIPDGHFGLVDHPRDRYTEAVAIQADFCARQLEA